MDELTAISRARALLQKHGATMGRVDIAAIASNEGFEVIEAALERGVAGQFMERKGRKVILVNEEDHPYRQRFTIAHEIAHQMLALRSAHGQALPSDELERYRRRPTEEILCDVFAAECLVPYASIQADAAAVPFSAESIAELSERYEASKPCIASRFAQAAGDHLAYVLVEEGVVRNVIRSKSLRELGLWIGVGAKVPKESAVHSAMSKRSAVEIVDIECTDWSHSDVASDFACHEEALHNHNFNQSIALLTFEEVARNARTSQARAQHDDDDELLVPLTGHMPWPKR